MTAPQLIPSLLVALVAGRADATATLSSDSLHLLDAASRQAEHGERSRARAGLEALLLSDGITIGMDGSGVMNHAVERGVRVWSERLRNCPFHFTNSSASAIKVRFVDDIEGGGDLQGQLHIHRLVKWGRDHASYRVEGTIEIRDNADGRQLHPDEVSAVVEHELGHLLGLDDEDEPGVLMGPFVPGRPVDGPTDEEVEILENFRAGVRRTIAQLSERRP
jgi:hypothetical protein